MRTSVMKISDAALLNNAAAIRAQVPARVKLMCVVKANAYGHGSVAAARLMLHAGADAFAVAIVEEAAELRNAGIAAPILILGGAEVESLREAVALDVSQAVYSVEALNVLQNEAARLGKPILPVDSEHSAVFQCLQAANGNPAERLILTASGGALRDMPLDRIYNANRADVLKHPTWLMGGKITVDCATMLNKGLEVIEAHYLFGMPVERIEVVVHPQSVIHSMVEFTDGAVLAQLGSPDMRGPIGYAMGFPERIEYAGKRLDFTELTKLTFMQPDPARYPCLGLALDAINARGSAPVILNGANEVAVDWFLKGRIPFGRIAEVVEQALNILPAGAVRNISDVYAADAEARRVALSILEK